MAEIAFAHRQAQEEGLKIIEKIKAGEDISDKDRFYAIRNIIAFSARDWSEELDKELSIIYQLALNNENDYVKS